MRCGLAETLFHGQRYRQVSSLTGALTVIATSGPSGTYPQRVYRNPLDSLVKFLDSKHKDNWAIWEFRAEGTGYPDSEVYNRVYHYPFPDHHPPPFALIPNIMASMRNWIKGGEGRVVVVHCKAGKGRSGTASCSYLISEEGWKVKDALKRFTERRMRPGWGDGVSIPSQLRWIGYVERWAKHGKIYVERQVEVLEVHCWGLRDGVKIEIDGFVNDGKLIKSFHKFTRSEREVVRGEIPEETFTQVVSEVMSKNGIGRSLSKKDKKRAEKSTGETVKTAETPAQDDKHPVETQSIDTDEGMEGQLDGARASKESEDDPGKGDVVFRPSKRIVLPTNDLNIDVEKRNKAAFDLTMVTSVAHVWFNTFFEGNGPEQNGEADESGVFSITWEAMDGIKGSSRKGTQAFDKVALVWKVVKDEHPGIVITEPKEGEAVQQSSPADWKGQANVAPSEQKDLGLRTSSPSDSTANLSKSSSVKSSKSVVTAPAASTYAPGSALHKEEDPTAGVRPHGPNGEPDVTVNDNGSGPSSAIPAQVGQPDFASAQTDGTVPISPIQEETGPPQVNGSQNVVHNGQSGEELKTVVEHSLGHVAKSTSLSS
ncbi:hypothetical protein EJ04DRAFT_342503 [Polyplosphaeria fusca]|uniref:phosphatidylinositol-3,4,5-trisphosphate 3-phosphatase n=1 Tax=Polyplosphaeria fusca TaxID=682080 RepID=A0A9P4QTL2_9PLEO|nr:hypothetical protein EJ04DRAFT_342503 [Polyplosphaeria fusca]